MTSAKEIIKDLCKLTAETFQFPNVFITPSGDILFEFACLQLQNPLYQNNKKYLFDLIKFIPDKSYDYPVFKKTIYLENFICISVIKNDSFKGTVLIGPSVNYRLSDEEINGIINDCQANYCRDTLFNYYYSVPVVKIDKLTNMGLLLFYLFNKKLLSAETMLNENKQLDQEKISFANPDLEVSKRLQNFSFHHDPLLEKKLFNGIKEGNVEEVRKNVNIVPEEELGVLSKSSYIRSKKNLAITSITVATRAAIDGGLHPEIAYTLSDIFIQRVEELNELKSIAALLENSLCTFAERVSKVREQRYSRTVATCQNYIFSRLYQEITLEELAQAVKLNPNYLSVLFKKEVGISVSEYIQECRIEEAKNLLLNTSSPISEICSWLNFTDQSYFTKVFKKYTGVTPKQFKEKN